MSGIAAKVKKLLFREESRSVVYMGCQLISMVFAFLINVVLTRYCANSEIYGQYKYATNFILTAPTICGLGITWSCAAIIAKDETENKNAIIAASVLWMSVISVIATVALYIGGAILPHFGVTALSSLQIVFPFLIGFMLQGLVNSVYSGLGESYKLSLFSLVPNVVVMAGLGIMIWTTGTLQYTPIILLYLFAHIATCIPKLLRVKFDFSDLKSSSKTLFYDVKTSGFKVYISSMFTSSATQIIALCCGSIFGYAEYGYYSLAASLSIIFQTIGSTMAVVNFKKYSNKDRIPKKDFFFMILLGAVAYVCMLLLIDKVFFWFYPQEYAPAIFYLKALCLSCMMNGFAMIFNRFFIGKGMGGKVMKNSIIVAITNVVVSIPMIWLFQINGLMIAALVCGAVCLIAYCIDYWQWLKGKGDACEK